MQIIPLEKAISHPISPLFETIIALLKQIKTKSEYIVRAYLENFC